MEQPIKKSETRGEREKRVQARNRQRKLSAMELLHVEKPELSLMARAMLMTGPKAQPPKRRSVEKMMRYLIASPLHELAFRHVRGPVRAMPRSVGREALRDLKLEEKYYGGK